MAGRTNLEQRIMRRCPPSGNARVPGDPAARFPSRRARGQRRSLPLPPFADLPAPSRPLRAATRPTQTIARQVVPQPDLINPPEDTRRAPALALPWAPAWSAVPAPTLVERLDPL
jgi:hypothetical protein